MSQHNIHIDVKSEYLAEQSSPQDNRYVFAYHIHIKNEGEQDARLLTRHWIITDGEARTEEVRGDGVIGEQPLIAAGKSYKYTSGAVLKTPVGSMQGFYGMVDQHGLHFNARIPVFRLAVPRMLH
ncbi:ApaG protein [Agitococcus lubricus]|uniref:Protein ApaG n=2 Tax=Agitococcus lubricus TaxID=1077255 RepID=A0A2T5J164_9GAMM|nr:Co2+/Mg2+ efflux protein ApaG [Agitococcus lubricus]PTQ90136.1 ApaG protein [Agitococcus lubricus]